MKNLIIRADVTTQIGTGHVMRCIALAQAWQNQGGDVTFLSHCDSEAICQRILDEGFDFIPIEKPHPDPNDLKKTLLILSNSTSSTDRTNITNPTNQTNSTSIPWLVLDGYHFTPDYQKAIRKEGYRLLVIDDIAHLEHYHADILLNQNIHASSLRYSCDRDTVKLLGCEHVLLRREFLKYKDWKRVIPDKAKKIIVTMGGSDPDNVTLKVIRTLNSLNDPDLEVKVIAGPANPNINNLEKEIHLSPSTFHLLPDVSGMPELMAWSDMAVTAAGSTCWELAFMGVPSITGVAFENQQNVAKGLERAKIFQTVGWYKTMNNDMLGAELSVLMLDKKLREKKSKLGRQLIDGKGAKKIVYVLAEQRVSHY